MKKISLLAKKELVYEAIDFVISAAKDYHAVLEFVQVELTVEEIFINIAAYAYPEGGGDVEICCWMEDDKFMIAFSDGGYPFNPLKKSDPDILAPSDQRPIGGLGIFLVKECMDEIHYRYQNGKNILTVGKKQGGLNEDN